jgi:hypothetical protein
VRSNRSAIGAGQRDGGWPHPGGRSRQRGSFASQSGLRLHFGLAQARKIDRVEIEWPSGLRQVERDLEVNQLLGRHVDLAVKPALKPLIGSEVLAEARVVYAA